MTAVEWAAVAAVSAAISAIVSLILSLFTVRAAVTQVRVADFNNCLEAVKQLSEALRKVRDAADVQEREFELKELLNLLEILALLANDKKLGYSTRRFVEPFIIEALAWISSSPTVSELMDKAITSDTTFKELRALLKANKPRIDVLTNHYASQTNSGGDREVRTGS